MKTHLYQKSALLFLIVIALFITPLFAQEAVTVGEMEQQVQGAPSSDVPAEHTCQFLGGIKCTGCCKEQVPSSNVFNCCARENCVDRVQQTKNFPGLGDAIIEKFPQGNYGVWHGEPDKTFGVMEYAEAKEEDGAYKFKVKGTPYSFNAIDDSCSLKVEEKEAMKDCMDDFSCDYYFVYVPVDNGWSTDKMFEDAMKPRELYLYYTTVFEGKKIGHVKVPVAFAAKECKVDGISSGRKFAWSKTRIKECADKYTEKLGISYERAAGVANEYTGGYAHFGYRAAFATRGFYDTDRPSIVTHEIGHTYNLCDEYLYEIWKKQEKQLHGCINNYPEEECPNHDVMCMGDKPVYKEYTGPTIAGACEFPNDMVNTMGASSGQECGFDKESYEAISHIFFGVSTK